MVRTQPYHLYLLFILVLSGLAIFHGDGTIDIHLHDTYFVIAGSHFYLAFAIILATLWLLSIAFRNIFLSPVLTWVHVAATLAFIAYVIYIRWEAQRVPRNYIDVSMWQRDAVLQTVAVFTLLIGLLALLINIAGGAVRKFTRQH